MKCIASVLFIALALAAGAQAEAPQEAPGVKPIESLWFSSPPNVTGDADAARARALKQWQQAKVFDAFLMIKLPPTLSDEKDFNGRANALIKEVGGRFNIATVPVGKEGWETSANQRLAQKFAAAGGHYDAGKVMTQPQRLETMKDLEADTWAWVLEQPAHMPTPEQAARSASEFVRFAKTEHKKSVIWLTAQGFARPSVEEMVRRICEATRADANYFGWMDLQEASLEAGESQWRDTMDHLLDKILTVSPREKTVIQWTHNPRWQAKDVEGTKTYISVCQAKGINRFCVLAPPQGLDRDPWREFYRTLPKAGTAAVR